MKIKEIVKKNEKKSTPPKIDFSGVRTRVPWILTEGAFPLDRDDRTSGVTLEP